MSDEIFRIVVAAGVLVICIAFAVQALVAVAFQRTARKMQQKIDVLADRIGPVVSKAGPVMEKLGPVIDSAGPVFVRIGPMLDTAGRVFDQIGDVAQKVGPAVDGARAAMATANRVMEDVRPHLAEVSSEVAGIARSGREQVERVGALLHDAADRARTRLEQIDETVDSTVEQVEAVGENLKRSVMRPVREVNGLAAGISAAFSTLVKGRKSSVDSATLDEEMFI